MSEALGDLVTDVDRRSLTGEFAEWAAASFRAAMGTGVAGWRDDDLAFLAPWGFDLAGITLPVAIWQGDQTPWCRSRTAAGWPGMWPERPCGSSQGTATCRSPSARSTGSSTNSLRAQAEPGGHAHMSAPPQPPRGLHEDGKGWTVMAVDRASRRWAVAQGTTQSATAVQAYEALHRDNRADARPNDHPATE